MRTVSDVNFFFPKTAIVIFLAIVIPVVSTGSPWRAREPSQRSTLPDEVVRQFYDWYLHAGLPSPERKNLATFGKYVTQRLLRKQMDPEVDADLFVDAQDFDETWKKNFTVSKATIQGQQATVQVTLKGEKVNYRLRVTLRRENSAWKIDSVKGSDWKNVGRED
jgi:hypothetical protein